MTAKEHIGHHPLADELLELVNTEELGMLASKARGRTKEFLAEGSDRGELLDTYESVIEYLYDQDLDEQAEELLEVMAELEGFCSPQARL